MVTKPGFLEHGSVTTTINGRSQNVAEGWTVYLSSLLVIDSRPCQVIYIGRKWTLALMMMMMIDDR